MTELNILNPLTMQEEGEDLDSGKKWKEEGEELEEEEEKEEGEEDVDNEGEYFE